MGRGIFYSAPNLVRVCVDQYVGGDMSGRLYHFYCRDALPFQNTGDLVMQMDQFYDALNFPQAAVVTHGFRTKTVNRIDRNAEKCQGAEEMEQHKGDIATFVVHVQYRQNATWQGKVVWTDENRECSFRSALELIKLMDNAMDSVEGQPGAEAAQD